MKLGSPDDPMVVLYHERIAEAQEFGMKGVVEALQRNLDGYKGTIGSLAEKKVRVATEAMNYTHEGFHNLSEVTRERLASLVCEALELGPMAGVWERTRSTWIVVVGPFECPKIVAESEYTPGIELLVELSDQNSCRMVWVLDRPPSPRL